MIIVVIICIVVNTEVSEPILTRDEKRFFWTTFNVNGIVLAPQSEIKKKKKISEITTEFTYTSEKDGKKR